MQLPNREKAYVPAGKLMSYILSETHAVGKAKAKFFRALGFDETNVTQLEAGFLAIAQMEEVEDFMTSPHGAKYIVDGSMKTPKGGVVRVRTIWITETEQENPRFVTAYPIE
jgi:hypothetical protein